LLVGVYHPFAGVYQQLGSDYYPLASALTNGRCRPPMAGVFRPVAGVCYTPASVFYLLAVVYHPLDRVYHRVSIANWPLSTSCWSVSTTHPLASVYLLLTGILPRPPLVQVVN